MRHQSPLEQKLATACGISVADLNHSLLSWPSPDGQPCWPGRRTIFHEGRPQTTVRLMIEHVMGRKADPTWRFVRKYCATTGCQNPHHYELQTLRKYDGSPVIKPPLTYFSAALRNGSAPSEDRLPDLPVGDDGPCLDITVEHENDFGDACDLVEGLEGGRRMSAEALHSVYTMYPAPLFERALAHVNRPRF